MRFLYSFIWCLALPVVLLRLWHRGRQEPGYRQHIAERLSFFPEQKTRRRIWLHAVSAGETRAAEPLIRALSTAYPEHQIVLTHMTPIGRSTGQSLFADLLQQEKLLQFFLPYDMNLLMRRFIRHFKPELGVLIETEVWPNLLAQAKLFQLPVCLVNARLSEKSLKKGLKLASLMIPAAGNLSAVAAQSWPDAERLKRLGVEAISVTGNIKFDVSPPATMAQQGAQLRQLLQARPANHSASTQSSSQNTSTRPIFICASTREGEEELIIKAYLALSQPPFLLIITPRHPQRFDQVAALLTQHKIAFIRRSALNSESAALPETTQVILGDSMGEMYMYYACADLAFIGGSLATLGGHNLIEACAMGKPVLTGPHTYNFSEITEQAIASGAALRASDASDLMQRAVSLLADPDLRRQMGQNAHQFFLQHQGATQRTIQALAPFLD